MIPLKQVSTLFLALCLIYACSSKENQDNKGESEEKLVRNTVTGSTSRLLRPGSKKSLIASTVRPELLKGTDILTDSTGEVWCEGWFDSREPNGSNVCFYLSEKGGEVKPLIRFIYHEKVGDFEIENVVVRTYHEDYPFSIDETFLPRDVKKRRLGDSVYLFFDVEVGEKEMEIVKRLQTTDRYAIIFNGTKNFETKQELSGWSKESVNNLLNIYYQVKGS